MNVNCRFLTDVVTNQKIKYLGFKAVSRILHLYPVDRLSEVGKNWSTLQRKTA